MNFDRRIDDIPPHRQGWRNLFRLALLAAVVAAWAWGAAYSECDTDEEIAERYCSEAADVNECIFGPAPEAKPISLLIEIFDGEQRTYEF